VFYYIISIGRFPVGGYMKDFYEDELFEEEVEEIEEQLESDGISGLEEGFMLGEKRAYFKRGAENE